MELRRRRHRVVTIYIYYFHYINKRVYSLSFAPVNRLNHIPLKTKRPLYDLFITRISTYTLFFVKTEEAMILFDAAVLL